MSKGTAIFSAVVAAVVVAFFLVLYWYNQKHPAGSEAGGAFPMVDSISCDSTEHSQFRLHTHLYIINNGKQTTIPSQIGIHNSGPCLYWIHTHDTTGTIHVEAPTERSFTFGQFLDIWQQYPKAIFGKQVRVYVNGQQYKGDLRSIELKNQENIVIEIGPKYISPPSYQLPANMP